MHDPYSPQVTAEPKRHGCLFYGCITLIVLAVLAAIALFALYRYSVSKYVQYTSESQEPFPPVNLSPEELEDLDQRVKDFTAALDKGDPVEPLVLDSEQINALIAKYHPEIKDRVHVEIKGDKVKGQVSIPMNLGIGAMNGRYLNGSADFNVSLEDGVLIVTIDSVTIKGQPVPESLMQGLRAQNLAKDAYDKPEDAETLRKIEKIEVKDGKIIIKARPKETSDSATKKEGDQEDKAKAESPDAEKEETAPAPKASADDKAPAPEEPKAPDAEKKEETAPAPKAAEQEAHALWQGGFTAGLMLTSV